MHAEKIKQENVIVLPSYVGLNHVLANYYLNDPFTTYITNNNSLKIFLERCEVRHIALPNMETNPNRKNLSELKEKLDTISKIFTNNRVHFFFYLSDVPMLYFIKSISKTNELIFFNYDPVYPEINFKDSILIRKLKPLLVSWLYYGLYWRFFPSIYRVRNKSYMLGKILIKPKSESFSNYKNPCYQENIDFVLNRINLLPEREILYIDNISVHFPAAAERMAQILNEIESLGFKVMVKSHPKFKLIKAFQKFKQIHADIPAEILVNQFKVVLGVSSMAFNIHSSTFRISALKLLNLPREFVDNIQKSTSGSMIYYAENHVDLISSIENYVRKC